MNVIIRDAVDGDQTILTEILYHALYVRHGTEPFPREIVDEPRIKEYVDGWRRPGDEGLIAIDPVSGEVVGAIWVRLFGRERPGYGFVDESTPELSMAVVPCRRAEGIGTALLRALLRRLDISQLGVSLSVSAENPARRLYLRQGFEVIASLEGTLTMVRPPKTPK